MKFVNTQNPSESGEFLECCLNSLPSLNGLWFPEKINKLDENFFKNIYKLSFNEIAKKVLSKLLEDESKKLEKVIDKAFNFPIKLCKLSDNLHILQSFLGPTLTFKDFGARFLANYLEEYCDKKINILVSTSGDTGSAMASAFSMKQNIPVTILYPKNGVSEIQELQLTTYDRGVYSYAIDGSFDNCQDLVKRAFLDVDLIKSNLVSANSINLARLLPQCLYYFYSYSILLKNYGDKIANNLVFVVPSGNCGNLVGGLIAKRMGLPVKHFIVGQNENNTLVKYLETGKFLPKDTIRTISNAMDVGNPSNFKRIIHMYKNKESDIFKDIKGVYIDEASTINGISEIYKKYRYIMDPHTSVGYNASKNYYKEDEYHVVIATAHPCKYYDLLDDKLGITVNPDNNLYNLSLKLKNRINMNNTYHNFKDTLVKRRNSSNSITLIGMPSSGQSIVANILADKLGIRLLKLNDNSIIDIQFNSINNIISTTENVINNKNLMQNLCNKNNTIIYLDSNYSTLQYRINGNNCIEVCGEIEKLYKKYCNFLINTDNYTPDEISQIIINSIYI